MVNKNKNQQTKNISVNPEEISPIVACKNSFQMREYMETIDLCNQALKLSPADSVNAELLSLRGQSNLQLRNFVEAEADLLKSQEICNNVQSTYLALCRLYRAISDDNKVTEFLKLGISNCSENKELQLLLTLYQNQISISACMIVKDEQELLPDCLESIRDWVDEIIIVDTGSSDQTMEIARSYGAKIYEQEWENDFSFHRNHSLSKATKDWILVIDADERITQEDIPAIQNAVKQSKSGLVALTVNNQDSRMGQISSSIKSVRLFKRDLGLTYSGIVHNDLNIPEGLRVKDSGARLIHVGYHLDPDQMQKKFNRTMSLLKKQVKSHPDDPFVLYNFVQQLRSEDAHYGGNNKEIILKMIKRINELTYKQESQQHLGLMANFVSAQVSYDEQDYENCLSICRKLVEQEMNYPDPWILSGFVHSHLGQYDQAAISFEHYLKAIENSNSNSITSSLILHYANSQVVVLNNLGIVAEMQEDLESAKNLYKQVLALDPENPNAIDRLQAMKNEGDGKKSESVSNTKLVDKTELILKKSREYILTEDGSNALTMLLKLHDIYPFDNQSQCLEFNRLLAFAYSFTGDYASAEIAITQGKSIDPNAVDLYFVESFLKLKMQEYSESVQSAQRYLQLVSNALESDIACTKEHISQTHNVLGLSLMATAQPELAEKAYRDSIRHCPENHLPYLNLFKLLKASSRSKDAGELVDEGLKVCSQVTELRMLGSLSKKRATVTACMIVKDEEKLLPGCLDSIRDWVDEIIIVDTGSTDNTMAIAKSYGAKEFYQEWEGNFSKHRNYSIDQATSDWVLIIDADERIQNSDISKIVELVSNDDCESISVNVRNVYHENDHKVTGSNSIRFFRRTLNLRYDGIVHNTLVVPDSVIVTRAPITFEHLGYDLDEVAMQKKFERTKKLIEKQLDDNRENAFAWFNLAQLLRGQFYRDPAKLGPQIIEAANHAKKLSSPTVHQERFIHLMALNQLAWTHYYMDDFQPALEQTDKVLTLKANYLDPLMLRGHLLTRTADYEGAKKAYRQYLAEQSKYQEHLETDSLILIHLESRAVALASLGAIAEFQEDFGTAIEHYEKTLKESPSYLQVPLALGRLYLQRGQLDKSENFLTQQLQKEPNLLPAHLAMAMLRERQGETKRADQHYMIALKIDAHDPHLLRQYADFCATHDRVPESVPLLERLKILNPKNYEITDRLASQYFSLEKYEQAAEAYSELIERTPIDAKLLNDLANCHFKMKQFQKAEELYRKAIAIDDRQIFSFRNLILCLVNLEQADDAMTELDSYLSNDKQDAQMNFLYGELLFNSSNHQQALAQYEACLRLNTGDPVVLCRLADCYLVMGHKDSAIMGYRQALLADPECEPAKSQLREFGETTEMETTQAVK